ncbi:hypothetical protein K461DRAFT_35732 [Myriangium duriaei CBS 260.36]|uniref:Uncharacterized protein n=1 Tax=Myriangium duriaei CBS 260.36 TaxID=1168546 RepID=A0A9P4J002_9PEZI|nr:hypothetical protein K461DRAFT_35732 [Myriangium duriaei CBS 260.36]
MPPARTRPVEQSVKYRAFGDLHYKDQQLKQTKKLCIEQNWQCSIEECLPPAIRPRVEVKKGAKARVDDKGVSEEKWWNWSVELLKSVEELSSMTEGELQYAQQLLEIEVELRQNNPRSSQRKILELLLGDAQKVVDEQRKRLAVKYTTDAIDLAGDSMDPQYDHLGYSPTRALGNVQYEGLNNVRSSQSLIRTSNQHGLDAQMQPGLHQDPAQNMLADLPRRSSNVAPRNSSGRYEGTLQDDSLDDIRGHLNATELRAQAAKLRARLMQMEMEAVEIEAQARELQDNSANGDY